MNQGAQGLKARPDAGRGKEKPYPESQRRLDFGTQNYEKINYYCAKPLSLWHFVLSALENSYNSVRERYVLEAVQKINEGLWCNSSRSWAPKVEGVIRVSFMKKVRSEQRHEVGEGIGHVGIWESAGLKNGECKSPRQEPARHV